MDNGVQLLLEAWGESSETERQAPILMKKHMHAPTHDTKNTRCLIQEEQKPGKLYLTPSDEMIDPFLLSWLVKTQFIQPWDF